MQADGSRRALRSLSELRPALLSVGSAVAAAAAAADDDGQQLEPFEGIQEISIIGATSSAPAARSRPNRTQGNE